MKRVSCNEITDIDLVVKSLEDAYYFSCLYYRYEAKLIRYIQRISDVSHDERLDILQESFIKVWKHLNDYDTDISLSSWIYRIVHNQTISHWRKSKSFGKDNKVSYEDYFMDSEDTNNGEDSEKEKLIQTIIYKLPINYQSVLILKYFEEKNYDEISDILKIPEGTVATRLNRAKKAFLKISKAHNTSFFD